MVVYVAVSYLYCTRAAALLNVECSRVVLINNIAAANHAATAKSAKYANLTSTQIFVQFVIETSGAWNAQAIELTQ